MPCGFWNCFQVMKSDLQMLYVNPSQAFDRTEFTHGWFANLHKRLINKLICFQWVPEPDEVLKFRNPWKLLAVFFILLWGISVGTPHFLFTSEIASFSTVQKDVLRLLCLKRKWKLHRNDFRRLMSSVKQWEIRWQHLSYTICLNFS